jgi:deazaflavin-dependent oxidoreductase (nitroreductase family)
MLRLTTAVHVALYRLSGGRLGATMNGMPVLLLTTRGRRSGLARTVPLVYLRSGTDYVIGAGIRERPAWYLNLCADPRATIQMGVHQLAVDARQAQGDERQRLWAQTPAYWDNYQKRAQGELPMMVLELQVREIPDKNQPLQNA